MTDISKNNVVNYQGEQKVPKEKAAEPD